MTKPRLFVIGHADTPTGYARVLHSLLPYLKDIFHLHLFAVNIDKVTGTYDWPVYPNSLRYDVHGVAGIKKQVLALQPDIIWVFNNFWYIPLVVKKLNQWSPHSKVAVYFPIEGDRIPRPELEALTYTHLAVTYTHYGKEMVLKAADRHGINRASLPPLEVIYHGIDTHTFYPLVSRAGVADLPASTRKAREQLFPNRPGFQDAFIVLNSNRNQRSKRIDLTVEGFSLFARNKSPKVKLFLNMARIDTGPDVMAPVYSFAVQDRVMVSRPTLDHPSYTNQELNWLYNACDVGVNTSLGEGWGLVSFEHAAAGKPQVVPAHSACLDLWKDNGSLLIPEEGPSYYPPNSCNTAINPADLAAQLERLYQDKAYYHNKARSAYQYVTQKTFSWEHIAARWKEWLLNIENLRRINDSPSTYCQF
ncbi:MAG: glycosyltransferase family 4 protein [Candidatus Aminicenantes bacterium]